MNNISSPRPVTDETIEQEIRRKGLTAPRITPEDLEGEILNTYYFTAADGVFGSNGPFAAQNPALNLLTFCVLVLRNGFTVTGESACASPENFNAEIGKKIARENAKQKLWPLLGYQLKQKLFENQL